MGATINGKAFDWADVSITISELKNIEFQEISYDDEEEAELVYGKGNKPRGYGTGNYKASGKASFLREDYNVIMQYCKKKKIALYDLVIPKIVVSFANDTQKTQTDVLNKVKFTKRSFKNAQGEKNTKIDLDFIMYGVIESNGVKG